MSKKMEETICKSMSDTNWIFYRNFLRSFRSPFRHQGNTIMYRRTLSANAVLRVYLWYAFYLLVSLSSKTVESNKDAFCILNVSCRANTGNLCKPASCKICNWSFVKKRTLTPNVRVQVLILRSL